MNMIDKFKFKVFMTRVKWYTTGALVLYKDKLCILVDGVIVYKGEKYDKTEDANRLTIKIKDDESELMRATIDERDDQPSFFRKQYIAYNESCMKNEEDE